RRSHFGGVLVPPGGARARALGGGPLSERIGVPLPRAAPRRRRRGGDLLPRAARAYPPCARQPRLPPRQPRGRHCRRPRLPRRLRAGLWRLGAHLLRPSRRRVLLVARRGQGRHLRRGTRTRGRKRTCYHRNDTEPSKEAVRMKKYQLMARARTRRAHPGVRAGLTQHSESSAGVLHDVRGYAAATRGTDAILIVDAVSSLGIADLPMDAWGVDLVVSGSQKGLMLPPGVAFCALGERAWARAKTSTLPKYYFNLAEERKALVRNEAHFTPAVGIIVGLREALRM